MNVFRMRRVLAKLEIHLERNQFEACRLLLDQAEKEESGSSSLPPLTIAELDLDLRFVNMLESEGGYIYLSEIEHVDIDALDWPNLGAFGKNKIKRAIAAGVRAREEDKIECEAQRLLSIYDDSDSS